MPDSKIGDAPASTSRSSAKRGARGYAASVASVEAALLRTHHNKIAAHIAKLGERDVTSRFVDGNGHEQTMFEVYRRRSDGKVGSFEGYGDIKKFMPRIARGPAQPRAAARPRTAAAATPQPRVATVPSTPGIAFGPYRDPSAGPSTRSSGRAVNERAMLSGAIVGGSSAARKGKGKATDVEDELPHMNQYGFGDLDLDLQGCGIGSESTRVHSRETSDVSMAGTGA